MSRAKPIVAVKSAGAARAYPDDGVAVPPGTLDVLIEQTGIVRVDTLAQQLHVARVLACQPLPAGNRVALVGNGGGSLALAADACVDAGLTLAELGPGVRAVVGEGPGSGPRLRASTVDLGFEARPDDLARALGALLADGGVDSVLVVCAPAPRQSTAELVAAVAGTREAAPDKTLVACVFGDHPTAIAVPGQADVPVFDFPDDAAYALGKVSRYARWRSEPEGDPLVHDDDGPLVARRMVADAVGAGKEGWLDAGTALRRARHGRAAHRAVRGGRRRGTRRRPRPPSSATRWRPRWWVAPGWRSRRSGASPSTSTTRASCGPGWPAWNERWATSRGPWWSSRWSSRAWTWPWPSPTTRWSARC